MTTSQLQNLERERAALIDEARALLDDNPSGLAGETLTRFETIETEADAISRKIETVKRVLDLVDSPTDSERAFQGAPNVNRRTAGQPWEIDRRMDGDELRGRALDALAHHNIDDAAIARVEKVVSVNPKTAARVAAAADPTYARAFAKMCQDPLLGPGRLTNDERDSLERAAMSVGSNTNGGFLVPTFLDPTIILTNSGSANPMRQLARVVTLTHGNVWNGVSSAGVTASWDAELAEVSDDSPTFARPSITAHKAQQFVQFSIEAAEDIDSLLVELGVLFADAKERLEGTAFATGSGSGQPYGIFTALNANTNVQITSTTAATIGEVDIHSVYRNTPQRFRGKGTWLMHPLYALAIKRLGTAVSSTFTGIMSDPTTDRILGRPVVESDDAPTTQTTTALDNELIFGDFSNYVIADKIGMSIELIPHLFNTANGRPDGRRGLYAHWRCGADSVNDDGFRMLVDRTSA